MMSEKQRDAEKRRRLGKELDELEEQMKATEGYRLHLKIRALRNSYYVFEANYRNLTVALDRVGKIENLTTLWAVDNRDKLDRLLAEITRLLHNFLAGAKTLVDHTRVFENDMYKGKGFEKVYQAKGRARSSRLSRCLLRTRPSPLRAPQAASYHLSRV
jgi:hypothetical protein